MTLAEPTAGPKDPLARLNPEQRAAVEHGAGGMAGPLLVIAGAGTGKTMTLVHRLAHLVALGADPRRIHHLERDPEFLIELPSGVQVLDMVTASGTTGGGP